MSVTEPLFGGLSDLAKGGTGGPLIEQVGGIFGGLFGSSGLGPLPTTFADVLHTGGVVGRSTTRAVVPTAASAGAPRFDRGGVAGFMPGEIPAVLHRGETVRTPAQEAALRRGGGGKIEVGPIVVNVPAGTRNPNAFGMSAGQAAGDAFLAALEAHRRNN